MARILHVEDDELAGELVRDVPTQAGHLVGVIDRSMRDGLSIGRADGRSLP